MRAASTDVDPRPAFVLDFSSDDPGDNQNVIARRMSARDSAIEERMGVAQERGSAGSSLHGDPFERGLVRLETLAEMAHQLFLTFAEDIDRDGRAVFEPIENVPLLVDGHDDLRRLEGALLHPTRQHSRFVFTAVEC